MAEKVRRRFEKKNGMQNRHRNVGEKEGDSTKKGPKGEGAKHDLKRTCWRILFWLEASTPQATRVEFFRNDAAGENKDCKWPPTAVYVCKGGGRKGMVCAVGESGVGRKRGTVVPVGGRELLSKMKSSFWE